MSFRNLLLGFINDYDEALLNTEALPAMQLQKSEQLNIACFSRLFDKKAECYKLFLFQAILNMSAKVSRKSALRNALTI